MGWCSFRARVSRQESRRDRVAGCRVATLPGPFHEQRARGDPEKLGRDGGLDHPHDLRPTRSETCERPVRRGRPDAGTLPPKVAGMLTDARDDLLAFATFPTRIGARSGPRTRSSGSTRKSNAAPTSSGYSPTRPRCRASPARSPSNNTTNGTQANAATSPASMHALETINQPTTTRRQLPSPNSAPHNQTG